MLFVVNSVDKALTNRVNPAIGHDKFGPIISITNRGLVFYENYNISYHYFLKRFLRFVGMN